MNEARNNQESVKVTNMKEKISFATTQMKRISELAASPNWAKLNPMEQEFYAAENAAWKTVARIVNIRLKIELGKAAKAKAMQAATPGGAAGQDAGRPRQGWKPKAGWKRR